MFCFRLQIKWGVFSLDLCRLLKPVCPRINLIIEVAFSSVLRSFMKRISLRFARGPLIHVTLSFSPPGLAYVFASKLKNWE